MITLAASMFDLPGIATGAAQIGDTVFLSVAALVAMLVIYGFVKHRRS
ncbi:MAG TPA: hypothetical protein VNG69_12990 [Casimicrobiaceae bacterium]|nr:hypothetical protein [Casimicrobiaceae bacterium]